MSSDKPQPDPSQPGHSQPDPSQPDPSQPDPSQPESQQEQVFELKPCSSCGAAVSVDETKCWLCGWRLADEVRMAQLADPSPPAYYGSSSLGGDAIAAMGAAVILGAATIAALFVAPGIGVLLAILFIIVLFTLAKVLRSQSPTVPAAGPIQYAYAAPTAPTGLPVREQKKNVVAQVFIAFGIALLLGIAAVIAFFTFCVICIVVMTNA